MSAQPQLAPQNEAPQKPANVIAPVEEAWLKRGDAESAENEKPTSIAEKEAHAAESGMEKLNEMGKNLNLQAEAGAQEFDAKTKSWWDRAKGMFKKEKSPAAVKGEAEILKEIEKADAVYAEFKKKYEEVLASGDEAALRGMESSLSQAYEQLAPQVAAEGASEAKAWKKALKTGEMPQITESGAKLNDVARRLADVRARLNGAPAQEAAPRKPQAEIVEEAPAADEEAIFTEAEKAQLAADAAKLTAPVAAEAPKKPDADAADRELLMRNSAGKPGEKLVDEYLKLRAAKSDAYGVIVGQAFDAIKGEIRLKYEDGSQLRKYANGLMLRIHPGGQVEEIKEMPRTETAPPADTMKAQDRAEMAARVDAAMEAEDAAAMTEGVVSGEIEAKEPAAEPAQEPSVIVEAPKPPVVKSSEQAPTASGTIGGEAEIPTLSVEPGPDLAMSPAPMKSPREVYPNLPEPVPGSRPPGVPEAPPLEKPAEAPVERPAVTPEAPESAFGKLEAKLDDAAAELLKMPEAAESPKTFPTKVGKLPADKFLEAFKAVGAVDAQGAKDFAEQFKMDSEGFDALRKKLAQVVRRKMKG